MHQITSIQETKMVRIDLTQFPDHKEGGSVQILLAIKQHYHLFLQSVKGCLFDNFRSRWDSQNQQI